MKNEKEQVTGTGTGTGTTDGADVQGAGVQSEKQTSNALATTEEKKVAVAGQGGAYITGLLEGIKTDFIAANDGLDMDFVRMGTWLTINKKGVFVDKDDENIKYGDSIDVVVGQGEKRWSLWGLKDSPEDGQLIVACKEKVDASAQLEAWLDEEPDRRSRYSINDLELRYMAYVVPVETVKPNEIPKVYLMSFAPSATIAWGKYAMKVYQGGYKNQGIAPRTGVNRVVTRLTTEEQQSKTDKSISWLAIKFDAVGIFDPKEYGITE
jgi:hypothetical protein